MKFNLFIFLISSLFFACHNKQEKAVSLSAEKLLIKDYTTMKLDQDRTFAFESAVVYEGQLVVFDPYAMQFFFYPIQQGSLVLSKTVVLDEVVKSNLEGMEMGFALKKEGILFISGSKVYQLNQSGELQSSFSILEKGMEGQVGGMPLLGTNHNLLEKGGAIITSIYPDVNAFDLSSLSKAKSIGVFEKEQPARLWNDYPAQYHENIFGYNFLLNYSDFDSVSNQLILSFSASEALLFYDIDSRTSISKQAASPYLKEVKAWKNPVNEFEQYTRFFNLSPSYSYVKYDPYKKLYYRTAEWAISEEEYEQGKAWKDKHLLIFNKELQLIDTLNLKDEHLPQSTFVISEGLLIAKFKSEDELAFDLLKVEVN